MTQFINASQNVVNLWHNICTYKSKYQEYTYIYIYIYIYIYYNLHTCTCYCAYWTFGGIRNYNEGY